MTDIAVFDTGLLNMQAVQMQAKKQPSSPEQKFMDFMSQAKDKTTAINQNVQAKENVKDSSPDFTEKQSQLPIDSEQKSKLSTTEETKIVQEEPAKQEEKITLEEQDKPEVVDEETLAQIQEALAKIMMMLEEMIGVSPEEMEQTLEALGMDTADLMQGNLSELILGLTGEDSIGMVMKEDLFQLVQDVNQTVNEAWQQLEELTGMSREQLQNALRSFEKQKPVVEEPADVETVMQNPYEEVEQFSTNMQESAEEMTVVSDKDSKEKVIAFEDHSDNVKRTDIETKDESEISQEVETIQPEKKPKQETDEKHSFEQNSQNQKFATDVNQNTEEIASQENTISYTDVDTDSIMKQIADYVKIQKNEDMTQMEMQLHPASLGTIKISLATKGGAVTAQFTAQNEAVKQALETQVTQLRTNLEEQGVKIDAIEISVASHQMERNLDQNGQNQQEQQNKEEDERINKIRRKNINLRAWANGDEEIDEIEDEDTKLTVEMMTMYGNSMDLLA